jgi:pimeloyl-ACP methyl ester carboxylesterase
MVEPTRHRVATNGVEIACVEWGAEFRGRSETILLAHATGFHARIWDPIVARLGERHVVAVDQRGHGRSTSCVIQHWDGFGRDLNEVVRSLELESCIGVGHSMGGHAMVEAAGRRPDAFERLLIMDPVIASPDAYGDGGWALPDGEPHPTSKRKNRFPSANAMYERFRDRHPYSLFDRATLRAYCDHALLPAPDGDGFVLACPPEVEASVYMTSRSNAAIHDRVRAVRQPVLILRAPPPSEIGVMDFSSSPTWPGLVTEFANATEHVLEDLTHFIPMQAPDLVARAILTASI